MEASDEKLDEEFVGAPYELEASDDETDDHKHAKLLQAMAGLGSKKKPSVLQRTEPTVKASEFNLNPGAGKVELQDLVGALKNTSSHGDVKKKLGKIQAKNKLLNAPLSTNVLEKIQRNIAYEGTSAEVSKWDPIVRKNRKAEQLEFPLVKPNVKMRTTNQMAKGYKPRTPLEIEVAKLLAGSKSVASKNQELTPAEEEALQAMSIEEAKERRSELQKYRALLTYKEAKARRQKKIKSKRFHRILRKERQKNEKKELETLQEKDPEAYADMLMKLHKDRIQERISLKHRGGSKFMKRQAIYGKYDDKARQAVADMLEKHKELGQKLREQSSSDDDDGSDNEGQKGELALRVTPGGEPVIEDKNPWMTSHEPNIGARTFTRLPEIRNEEMEKESDGDEDEEDEELSDEEMKVNKTDQGIDDIFEDAARRVKKKAAEALSKQKEEEERVKEIRRKKQEARKKQKQMPKRRKMEESESDSDSSESESEDENETDAGGLSGGPEGGEESGITSSLTRKKTLDDFEGMSDSESTTEVAGTPTPENSIQKSSKPASQKNTPQVDPKKFLTISTQVKSSIAPELIGDSGEVEEEQEDQQRLTIAQAFASDDVVEEFKSDKSAAIEKDKPKDIDLTLPGWGDWGGTGITLSKRKRKRFVIKAPPAAPRKDSGLKGVIISETKDNSIAKHQVKNLPFPFTSVHQFESSVRAPIGKTWNPENAYRDLIKPKIVTKMGTIIDPIDKAHVFKKDNSQIMKNNKKDMGSSAKKPRKGGNQQKKKKKS